MVGKGFGENKLPIVIFSGVGTVGASLFSAYKQQNFRTAGAFMSVYLTICTRSNDYSIYDLSMHLLY